MKVQWKHLRLDEATWDMEEDMGEAYPFLFNFESIEGDLVVRGRVMQ